MFDCQLQHEFDALVESGADELRKSELSDSIECLNAAVAVQLPKMLAHTMKIIIDNFNILLRNGHRVPLEHEVLGTRVHAVELSEADKDDSYFVAISLQNTDGQHLNVPTQYAQLYCIIRTQGLAMNQQ